MESTENRQCLLETFAHLSEKRKAEFLDFMRMVVKYSGFSRRFRSWHLQTRNQLCGRK